MRGPDGGVVIRWGTRPSATLAVVVGSIVAIVGAAIHVGFAVQAGLSGTSSRTAGDVLIGAATFVLVGAPAFAAGQFYVLGSQRVTVHEQGIVAKKLWSRRLIPWSAVRHVEVVDGLLSSRSVRLGDGTTLEAPTTFRWAEDPDFDAKVAFLRAWCAAGVEQPLDRRPPPPIGWLPPPPFDGWGPAAS